MYYQWEWLSDLAIIPAWECFLAGAALGIMVSLIVMGSAGGKK